MLQDVLRVRRQTLQMSQLELARRAGLTQGRISDYERGIRLDMSFATAIRLARALGLSLDQLADVPTAPWCHLSIAPPS